MLNWLKEFGIFAYLDNNEYSLLYNKYEVLIGAGAKRQYFSVSDIESKFAREWLFGHINYDYKNTLYKDLESRHPKLFQNPEFHFFEPEIVIYIAYGTLNLHIESDKFTPEAIFQAIINTTESIDATNIAPFSFEQLMPQEKYNQAFRQVQEHIRAGDCYELNLCVAAKAKVEQLDPFALFYQLNKINPAPFAAMYKLLDCYALSSSPERFLMKNGAYLVAQPMKGTIRRSSNLTDDEGLKEHLKNDIKERAENVMITDLMRNDLAISCEIGSIKVPELFGVYTLPTLHTMVSTVTGKIRENVRPLNALLSAFPMGSMSGAPKKIVMEIIESLELTQRELYAGCIGYCSPDRDFDFNVVIRTLMYHAQSKVLSYQTGGAVTIDSTAENEWSEIALKAKALQQLFD